MTTDPNTFLAAATDLLAGQVTVGGAQVAAADALTGLLALAIQSEERNLDGNAVYEKSYVEGLEQRLANIELAYDQLVDVRINRRDEDALRKGPDALRIALFGLGLEDF